MALFVVRVLSAFFRGAKRKAVDQPDVTPTEAGATFFSSLGFPAGESFATCSVSSCTSFCTSSSLPAVFAGPNIPA